MRVALVNRLLGILRQWKAVGFSLLLALGWGVSTFQPVKPVYESAARIRVQPSETEASGSTLTGLESQRAILESEAFAELLVAHALLEQIPKARQEGPACIWPGLDGPVESAKTTVRCFRIETDPVQGTLELRFRAPTAEQAGTLALLVPRLLVEHDSSRVGRKYGQIRRFIEAKLHEFQARENNLTQRIWALRGSVNAFLTGVDASSLAARVLPDSSATNAGLPAAASSSAGSSQPGSGLLEASLSPDPQQVQTLTTQLQELVYRKTLLLRENQADDPQVAELSARIEETRKALDATLLAPTGEGLSNHSPLSRYSQQAAELVRLDIELGSLEQTEKALAQNLEASRDRPPQMQSVKQELARLDSESAHFRELRQSFHKQLEELALAIQSERQKAGSIQILDPLDSAPKPVFESNLGRHFSIWSMFGLAVGIVFALFLDFTDTSIKTGGEVGRLLGLPLLASVPSFKGLGSKTLQEAVLELPQGRGIAQAFETLKTRVEFKAPDRPMATLLVSSARAGEGKTTIAASLASTFARGGERVLLVDGSLAGPSLHHHFGIDLGPGLSNFLEEPIAWKSTVRPTALGNLWLLPAGDREGDCARLLGSGRMRQLVDDLSASYDRVVFDLPAVLEDADAAQLASVVEGVLLVVAGGRTPRHLVEHTARSWKQRGAARVGVVFNRVP